MRWIFKQEEEYRQACDVPIEEFSFYEVSWDQEQKRDSKENVTRKLSEWGVFQVSSLVALAKNLSLPNA